MNVSKFATMPRPGIRRDAQRNRLMRMRDEAKAQCDEYRAAGKTVLANRAEHTLRFLTHRLMELGAFR